ncbi:hypothetical protein EHS13_20345 [Paenibacillus psychroresistens]|uniref:Uncharacterized protein n=1 Tax=Paenibacillus psychroresistens TaxID=1778678 RepID=A0A6B8RL83_9BACL|nr:DUF6148 family protein [Paenibacillus psychroresistens]QGQ97070.1 hypothetical protein EHS13_20345 [Paenibacillus psychroresistens]
MAQYSLEVSQMHLDSWLAAELALSTAQSYTIGSRSLTRVDLKDVMTQIRYWQNQVNGATPGMGKKSKVRRYIPIDL